MQGRRLYTDSNAIPVDAQRGDYWRDPDGLWWAYVPNDGVGVLSNHTVTEHEDGTITVSPSILMPGAEGKPPRWHGFLEHGVWREV